MNHRWLAILLLILAAQVHGADMLSFSPTVSEMALLPEYCKVKMSGNTLSPEYRFWMQRLGTKYQGLHHYCAGLNYINRYQRLVNDGKREYYLSRAVPEIDYVVKDMPADFPLAGEIYLNRGIAHQLMGKNADAITDFTKSIEHDPKQVRAYLYLAEFHIQSGGKIKALDMVTTGLKRVPGSKVLQRKYLELGGKEPFPEADIPQIGGRPEPEKISAEVKRDDAPSDVPFIPGSTVSEDKSTPELEQGNVGKALERTEIKSESEEVERLPIGSPSNPYCRFCP